MANYVGKILIEKPVFERYHHVSGNYIYVGYNLRFHPVIKRLQELLEGQKIINAVVYAGQYLPDWRLGTEYQNSYSARRTDGGGVLRDLSHELDYLQLLFNGWESVVANGGQLSSLEITSEDSVSILLKMEKCRDVCLHLNYLDRLARRFIVVNTDQGTISADLISGEIVADGVTEKLTCDRDEPYQQMHQAILSNNGNGVATLAEGLAVLELIEGAELSLKKQAWIEKTKN